MRSLLLGLTLAACGADTLTHVAPAPDAPPPARARLVEVCYGGVTPSGPRPLSRIIHELRATERGDVVDVSIVFSREFVDNTYGANAVGWRKHSFKDLVGSDHTVLSLSDASDVTRAELKLDYLSEAAIAPSGYSTLGVSGGDGRLLLGDATAVLSVGSSMDDNLNARGYALTTSSPETDPSYRPDPAFPDWNYWVEYRVSVSTSLFGAEGFGAARMASVHASPSKLGENTIEVEPTPCPSEPDVFPSCARTRPEDDCAAPGELCEGEGCDAPPPSASDF